MILSGGLGQLKLCAPKGGAQLRNKFLGGVGVVAESARQVSPAESVRVSRPVSVLLSAPVPGEAASGLGSACRETMVRRHARTSTRARASANRTGWQRSVGNGQTASGYATSPTVSGCRIRWPVAPRRTFVSHACARLAREPRVFTVAEILEALVASGARSTYSYDR